MEYTYFCQIFDFYNKIQSKQQAKNLNKSLLNYHRYFIRLMKCTKTKKPNCTLILCVQFGFGLSVSVCNETFYVIANISKKIFCIANNAITIVNTPIIYHIVIIVVCAS